MTPEQEAKVDVLTLEVKRLSARLNDAIELIYNLDTRLTRVINNRLANLNRSDMPKTMASDKFVPNHGAGGGHKK